MRVAYIRRVDRFAPVCLGRLVHEPSEKSVPSEGTSKYLLFIEGIHVDITKMHDGLSKLAA